MLVVRIRSPNLALPEDYAVSVEADACIARLKMRLAVQDEVASAAGADEMTLIYQGRILRDDELLAAVLRLGEPRLVQVPNTIPGIPSPVALHTALAALYGGVASSALGQQQQNVQPHDDSTGQQHQHGLTRDAAADAAVEQNQPQAFEAEQQAQRELEQQQREQLERSAHFWLLAKLAFFSYIFSQDASLERMCTVHAVALIIFLQQTGRLAFLHEWWANYRNGRNNAQAPMVGETAVLGAAAAVVTATGDGEHVMAASQPSRSAWRQMEHALTTFVTSLVPTESEGLDPLAADQGQGGGDVPNAQL
ncbi:hypothetical protein THASP1DRAFT_22477 [Thamnocephalis sphaerospora]|uniref:Ubiquitin-like domain-containing protein n=1 Tax=Thamnocephalis sphaerospora TaxID=78915 RepID=A0A4P9XU36_9FUNG|nr:hypothetical protein THASP1DRAFT_22477 [Thamnocephalis sphaerospora]|eukprot:RKP09725.1 hypothetical protein THASP1DRAFT_22477 [Thamnocephalis sphaerospora]